MQKALITGGSSGIGLELAKLMAGKGHDLVLCSRNKDSLDKLAAQLSKKHDVYVTCYAADLSLPNSAKELYEQVKSEDIEILINNAGAGYIADFFDGDLDRNTSIAQLNMVSLMELCHLFGNDFKRSGSGRILNIGSIASFMPGPPQPVYYATKAFVRSLGRALAFDLSSTNITVTTLHPGVTKTKFFDQAKAKDKINGADPASVAKLGYKAMMQGRVEVTHGFRNKIITNVLVRIVPYRLQTMIVGRSSKV